MGREEIFKKCWAFRTQDWKRQLFFQFCSKHHIVLKVCACVCGFIFPSHYLKIYFFFFSFFFCIFWSTFGKATCKKFSRLFFLFVSNLFSQPSFYISNISLTFCLRISLICVGGCLVCVLIFFFSIYYIFFFSLSSSLDLFFI